MATSNRPIVGPHILQANVRVGYSEPYGMSQSTRSVRVEVDATFFTEAEAQVFEQQVRDLLRGKSA